MNWSNDKSLKLSKICVWLFAFLLIGLRIELPFFFRSLGAWQLSSGFAVNELLMWMDIIMNGTVLCAGVALFYLYRLLHNISLENVFFAENVQCLRVLSWCCLIAGLVFFIGVWFSPMLAILGGAAGFVGLILRVVKNVFAQAVALKDENDATI